MTAPDERPAIVWLRSDLRLADNPAFSDAARSGRPVIALYVLDTGPDAPRALGAASRWWLHHSLDAIGRDLEGLGVPLVLRRGAAGAVVTEIVRATGAGSVHWNRRYDREGIAIDRALKASLTGGGVAVKSHQANLLHEPWDLANKAGEPFRVFSPFWRAALGRGEPRAPLPRPGRVAGFKGKVASDRLADWDLRPTRPDWAGGLREAWTPGEAGAAARLSDFLETALAGYADARDRPGGDTTSRLSPHLAFGEISPFQIWHGAVHAVEARGLGGQRRNLDKFLAELGWREFSYTLLHHWPDLARVNLQPRFDAFPWSPDATLLAAWRHGRTGVPIVDAGMRQLWHTGFMHNRVRMIVASFLVKHLLQDWRDGEAWFWDTLVDADPANNAASWQWVAGSGADAAPYFRVFNPVLQGAKFDEDGAYVRRFVPELRRLPSRHIHAPWEAPVESLREAGVMLGETYPRPIVDLAAGRDRALAAFAALKSADAA
jgi:deoxyribodipyrimidine photo-lyase